MLINKLLLEERFIFIRSINLDYLKYIMDFDLIPIVRWIPVEGKWQYISISYGDFSLLEKKSIPTHIRPLNTSEIKDFLFDLKIKIDEYNSILPRATYIKVLIQSHLGGTLYMNRNDLLC